MRKNNKTLNDSIHEYEQKLKELENSKNNNLFSKLKNEKEANKIKRKLEDLKLQKKKNNSNLILVGLGLIIILCICISLIGSIYNDPEDMNDEFISKETINNTNYSNNHDELINQGENIIEELYESTIPLEDPKSYDGIEYDLCFNYSRTTKRSKSNWIILFDFDENICWQISYGKDHGKEYGPTAIQGVCSLSDDNIITSTFHDYIYELGNYYQIDSNGDKILDSSNEYIKVNAIDIEIGIEKLKESIASNNTN